MEDGGVSSSCLLISEQKTDSLYPMLFGISCALFSLKLLSEPELKGEKWEEIRDKILQGSTHLLGLLIWRVQKEEADNEKSKFILKLDNARRAIEELKRRRSEDAKANEKVVGIFAAHEQGWFNERKKLKQQIGNLVIELRVLEKRKDEIITKLNEKVHETENLAQSKDKSLEEEVNKRREIEEKLKIAENANEELRENAKRESQDRSNELWKHKTAFIELVSTQRQFEAEMGRAVRQLEAAKQDLNSVMEQKDQAVLMTQKLSLELVKMRTDLDQKDKILSAMLRKSKLDTSEKQMLLKEVKLSKTRRQQAELETERWRAVSESRHERHSLRSILSKHAKSKSENSSGGRGAFSDTIVPSNVGKTRSQSIEFLEYDQLELTKEPEAFSPISEQYVTEGGEELVLAADVKQLEIWVQAEAEKYMDAIQQRHHLEIDAFAGQLRFKDEKLESFHWRLLSMEIESKRLQSHIESLEHNLSLHRRDNLKLEALLLDRENELHSLKAKANSNSSSHDTVWSKVKIIKRKTGEKEEETTSELENSQEKEETQVKNSSKDKVLTVQSPEKEFEEEEKDVVLDPISIQECGNIKNIENLGVSSESLSKKIGSTWKMDLHALGVSYKIKRLKQQLLLFERLTGKKESLEDGESNENVMFGTKGVYALMSLLNKQVSRYLSLQGKTDDLCKRMHENDLLVNRGDSVVARTKEENKMLEHFLEETFHLQRYIVATGQKLVEIQSKISSGFVGPAEELEGPTVFDMQRFSDILRTLFREVQRGLEVRIARIIGDLEGTLACEGMIHLRK